MWCSSRHVPIYSVWASFSFSLALDSLELVLDRAFIPPAHVR